MNIYKEAKEIAKCNAKIRHLAEKLSDKIDTEGLEWETAQFVSFSKEDEEHYRKRGNETKDYFVDQTTGYCEDNFYGYVYFKTDVPGQYVRVHFDM